MPFRSRVRPRSRAWFVRTKQPHHVTWLVALILAALAIAGTRMHIDYVSQYAFWVMLAAYVLLALGTVIDGL